MKLALPCGQSVSVDNLAQASTIVRAATRDMNYHEFYSSENVGLVTDEGKPVARVSYNGRVWDPADDKREILI